MTEPELAAVLDRGASSPGRAAKERIAAAIRSASAELIELSHRIHALPEIALHEERAAGWVAEALERHGYTVQRGVGRSPTALRAVRPGGRGEGGRRVGILAEYDALPGVGHGCGHNSMAASAVGAAIGLGAVSSEVAGEIVFLGTPAEKRYSGKATMIEDGVFDGLDAALIYHPSERTRFSFHCLALEDVDVEFLGRASHASMAPWMGRNALDAMTLLLVSVGLWRQQLVPGSQVHGTVTDGGQAANAIPSRSAGAFIIRSSTDEGLDEMRARFKTLVAAAALAADCEGSATFHGRSLTMDNNRPLVERFRRNVAAYGISEEDPHLDDRSGSTDMGNVSKIVPSIHPMIAICPRGTPAHSAAFREFAAAPRADLVTLVAAAAVAQTAFDVLTDEALAEDAWRAHRPAPPETSSAGAGGGPDMVVAPESAVRVP